MNLPPSHLFVLHATPPTASGALDLEYIGSKKQLNKIVRSTGIAPLHMAARFTHGARIHEMIAQGALVDIRAEESASCITPLFAAALHFNASALDALLLAGADVTLRDSCNRSILMYMLYTEVDHDDRLVCARKLVVAGAPLNTQADGGSTVLHLCLFEKNTALLEFLLECGADQNLPLFNGWTPLHVACSKKDYAGLELLLACPGTSVDAQTNTQKATALQHAASLGDYEMVFMLLAAGADPLLENAHGANACNYAELGGHIGIGTVLVSRALKLQVGEMFVVSGDGTLINITDEIAKRAARLALLRQKLQNAKDNRVLRLQMGCAVCKAPTSNKCAGCRHAYYCSSACQRSDWRAHKTECKSKTENESAK